MSDKNAGVKEGRTRINFIIDNDLLDALDGVADNEGVTRTDILLFLLEEGMEKRGYCKRLRKFPEYTPYWLECMATRKRGAFFEGPQPDITNRLTVEQEEAIAWNEICNYEDEWGEDYLERRYDPVQNAAEYQRAEKRIRDIEKVYAKYSQLIHAITLDEEEERRELERKLQVMKLRRENSGTEISAGTRRKKK